MMSDHSVTNFSEFPDAEKRLLKQGPTKLGKADLNLEFSYPILSHRYDKHVNRPRMHIFLVFKKSQ